MRKLPIGIQGFQGLRNDGYLYVDKTEYIYQLAQTGKEYFLSRPRRFGKSLLLSAMKYYWEGRRDLFTGLKIEELEVASPEAWKPHPVFLFDFNGENYQEKGALENILDEHLNRLEDAYHIPKVEGTLGKRFRHLLMTVKEQIGCRIVVLVDEYDKPLLEVMEHPELEEHNKAVFKGFFSSLKGMDEYIRFVFITGVTKFEKVSIFSDLNQLRDISVSKAYASICGMTEQEIRQNFGEEIRELAEEQELSVEECLVQLKKTYDGYRFHPQAEGVYNPISLLNAFADREFRSYWFETGTPTFLVKKLKKNGFDIRRLTDGTLYVTEAMLSDYRADNPDPVPLLYQTGYLTIADYDRSIREFTLTFPNEEVKYGFLESLMPEYVPESNTRFGTDIFSLRRCVIRGDLDGIRNILTALFAGIPYTLKSVL